VVADAVSPVADAAVTSPVADAAVSGPVADAAVVDPAVSDPALSGTSASAVGQSAPASSGDTAILPPSTATIPAQAGSSDAAAVPFKDQTGTGTQAAVSQPAPDTAPVTPPDTSPAAAGETQDKAKTEGTGATVESGVLKAGMSLRANSTSTGADLAVADRVGAVNSVPEPPQLGLLAAIAAVFALGVGIAAIRAFASERAY
jgi:hypothetical protein